VAADENFIGRSECQRCQEAPLKKFKAAERLVVNTGPLIALHRAKALEVVGQLPVEFLSPHEVQNELFEGVRHGHPSVSPSWIRFVALAKPLDL
jgi:hypothetical protein